MMNEKLLELAESLVKVAEGLRGLVDVTAEQKVDKAVDDSTESKTEEHQDEAPIGKNITIETIRAVLAKKSQEGKTKEVKVLLNKYNAEKLSAVNPEHYPALFKDAEVL